MRFDSRLMLISLVAISLLIFGCTNPQTPQAPASNSNSNNPAVPNSPPSNPTPSTSPTPPAQNLAGLGYAQLVALGIPIECDIASTTSAGQITMKLYMDGTQKNRVELRQPSSRAGSSCSTMAMVRRGNSMLIGCNDGSPYMNTCQWLQLDVSSSTETGTDAPSTTPSSAQTPDYANLPPTSYNCRPWIADNSKFETPGRVCDFNELYGGSSGYPSVPPTPE
ncbi:hypothetical protein HY990_06825 [Candidatus Micrarchaeota archaeon]|nr:hypothetical protein [Candidatus Micrarchaeota archaeon]